MCIFLLSQAQHRDTFIEEHRYGKYNISDPLMAPERLWNPEEEWSREAASVHEPALSS